MIFKQPLRMNGALNNAGTLKNKPVNIGEMDAPIERAMAVMPEAADRSSGSTTAIVYDWRVGTSIWEMLNRKSKSPMARGRVGINGTRINRIFDGMCVKTIVLISPILFAMRTASNAEMPARIFAPKKILPSVPASTSKRT